MTKCDICKDEHSESTKSCEACHKVVKKYQNKTKYPMEEVRKALINAYSHKDREKKESYFKCAYTRMVGNFNTQNKTLGTHEDALVLTLDHENPEDKKNSPLVVSLHLINQMKSELPRDKFEKIVIALGKYFDKEINQEDFENQFKQVIETANAKYKGSVINFGQGEDLFKMNANLQSSNQLVDFRGILLRKSDVEVLEKLEEQIQWKLEHQAPPQPLDVPCFHAKNNRVTELIIHSYHKPSLESLPDEIGKLYSLERLDLAENTLQTVPESIGNLHNLKELDLRHNKISHLPTALSRLKALEHLDISENHLCELPEGICELKNLYVLDLAENTLQTMPKSIGNLHNLKGLDLRHNKISHLPTALSRLKALEHLNISENHLCELPEGICELKNLHFFYLSENNTSSIGHINFPNAARIIPPCLLFSKNRELRREAKRYFRDSLNILENLDDYLEDWLSGNNKIFPYLIKLGLRLKHSSVYYKRHNITAKNEKKLSDLFHFLEMVDKKSKLRIQFINFVENTGSKSYPMGLLYVSAHLKKHGFTNIDYVDYVCVLRDLEKAKESPWNPMNIKMRELMLKNLFSNIDEMNPHLLFLGPITSMHLVELIDIIPKLRKRYPQKIILAGGPHFRKMDSMDEELLKKCEDLDGIIVGEGEETALEIAERFHLEFEKEQIIPERKDFIRKLENIAGVRTNEGTYQYRELPELESLPFPDMELLEVYWENPNRRIFFNYNYSLSERRNPTVVKRDVFPDIRYYDECSKTSPPLPTSPLFPYGTVVGSRGCPFICTYCCSSGKRERRIHSARHIFDQMVELYENFGIQCFVFFDPLFMTSTNNEMHRIEELCNMLLEANYGFNYIIDLRCDVILQLPYELLFKMIQSGCTQFNLGLEKGSNKALKKLKKREPIEKHFDAIEKIRYAARKGKKEVLINGTFILGGPGETKLDIKETLIHGFSLDLDGLIFYPLEIHPGTEIYRDALDEGVLEPGLESYLNTREYPLYTTDNLPRDYLLKIQELSGNTIGRLQELKTTIRKIEVQLHNDKRHYVSGSEDDKIGILNRFVREFIAGTLGYLKNHPNENLVENGEIIKPLNILAEDVEREINQIEDLFRQNPNYHPKVWDYWPGTLSSAWKHFIKQIKLLFANENFTEPENPKQL